MTTQCVRLKGVKTVNTSHQKQDLSFFRQMIQTVRAANRILKYRPKHVAAERTVPNTLHADCERKRNERTGMLKGVTNTALFQDIPNLWVK